MKSPAGAGEDGVPPPLLVPAGLFVSLYASGGLVMLSVIAAIVALNVRRAPHENPVNSIKNE